MHHGVRSIELFRQEIKVGASLELRYNVIEGYRGTANCREICFGRTEKLVREPEDIVGNRYLREIIRETANNIAIFNNYSTRARWISNDR